MASNNASDKKPSDYPFASGFLELSPLDQAELAPLGHPEPKVRKITRVGAAEWLEKNRLKRTAAEEGTTWQVVPGMGESFGSQYMVVKGLIHRVDTLPADLPESPDPPVTSPGRTGLPVDVLPDPIPDAPGAMLVRFREPETRDKVKKAAKDRDINASEWLREAVREKLAREDALAHPERAPDAIDGKTRPVRLSLEFEHLDGDKITQIANSIEKVAGALGAREIRIHSDLRADVDLAKSFTDDFTKPRALKAGDIKSGLITHPDGTTTTLGSGTFKMDSCYGVSVPIAKPVLTKIDHPPDRRDIPPTAVGQFYTLTDPLSWVVACRTPNEDRGIQWRDLPLGSQAALLDDFDLLDPAMPWLCLDDGYIYKYEEPVKGWRHQAGPGKFREYRKRFDGGISLQGAGLGIRGVRTVIDEHGNRV